VPAAAVIPAPRAYTNIAAVKTLVVCHRAAGLPSGQPVPVGGSPLRGVPCRPRWCWTQPSAVCPCSHNLLFVDGENRSCRKPASLQAAADLRLPHWPRTLRGARPRAAAAPPSVHHRSPPSVTPWKTHCAQSILLTGRMSIHGMSRYRPSVASGVVLALGPTLGNLVGVPAGPRPGARCDPVTLPPRRAPSAGPAVGRAGPVRLPRTCGLHPSIATDGTVRGERYRSARGEILRSLRDPLQRRRSARARPSIKNESPGSKDDQTPS